MKVLIVDDVPDYLNSLLRALRGEHEVLVAENIEKAKEQFDKTIGLALLDVRLSEEDLANRDGILLLSWIKETYPEVPVVMMSAYRDYDATVDALNLGAAYFLKKPINLRELKGFVSTLAGAKSEL